MLLGKSSIFRLQIWEKETEGSFAFFPLFLALIYVYAPSPSFFPPNVLFALNFKHKSSSLNVFFFFLFLQNISMVSFSNMYLLLGVLAPWCLLLGVGLWGGFRGVANSLTHVCARIFCSLYCEEKELLDSSEEDRQLKVNLCVF